MFILQVLFRRQWKWGIVKYDTMQEAEARVKELAAVGIRARVRRSSELYG